MLLLFDIDGTLLRGATDAHRDAVLAAVSTVFGVARPAAVHIAPAGRTDAEIARLILIDRGVAAERIDAGLDDLRAAACEEYAQRCPQDLSSFVLPGVPELLADLGRRPGVRLALLTGNFEPIARLKLARAGIGAHFEHGQGAFGSDAEDRAQLPEIARRRAGPPRAPYPRRQTLVIGDTPRDIACAHADGVACLAVATGPFAPEDLGEADEVARDAFALAGVLERRLAEVGAPRNG